MKPFFGYLIIFICIALNCDAQSCKDYVEFKLDSASRDSVLQFSEPVFFRNSDGKTLSIEGMAAGNDLAMIFTLGNGNICVKETDLITLIFAESGKYVYRNNNAENCLGKAVLYFNVLNLGNEALDLLKSRNLLTIEISNAKGGEANSFPIDSLNSVLIKRSVSCLYTRLRGFPDHLNSSSTTSISDDIVYTVVESAPEYEGGYAVMSYFIINNMNRRLIRKAKNTGTVYVQFVVEPTGALTEIKTIRTVDPLLDKEAERLVSIMPPWKPGMQNGTRVRVRFVLPINFK